MNRSHVSNHLCLPKYVCIHLLPIVGLDNFLQIVVWNQFCCKYLFTVIFCCKFSFSIIFLQVCKFDHLFLQAAGVSFIHHHFSHLVPFLGNCITNSFSFCKLFFWISFCSTKLYQTTFLQAVARLIFCLQIAAPHQVTHGKLKLGNSGNTIPTGKSTLIMARHLSRLFRCTNEKIKGYKKKSIMNNKGPYNPKVF